MVIISVFVVFFLIITAVFSCIRSWLKAREEAGEKRCGEYSDSILISDGKKILRKMQIIINIAYIGVVLLCMLFGAIYHTNEQQIGFTSMFGVNTPIDGPGIHFKTPFLSEKHIYDATTQGMPIGYVESSDETIPEDSLMITSDFNFINIDFYIEYRITDPIEYCYGCDNPESVFHNIAQASIRNTVGMYDVDSVMTTGKTEIEMKVFDDIINELEKHYTGLTVVNVTIQDVEAPTTQVINAFREVSDAKSNADTYLNEANAYMNTQKPTAEANAEQIRQEAIAAKTERINAAKEEVARFNALYNEYSKNPSTVRRRMYYEAIQEIFPNMEIIIGEDAKVIYINDKSQNTPSTVIEKNEQQ